MNTPMEDLRDAARYFSLLARKILKYNNRHEFCQEYNISYSCLSRIEQGTDSSYENINLSTVAAIIKGLTHLIYQEMPECEQRKKILQCANSIITGFLYLSLNWNLDDHFTEGMETFLKETYNELD